MEHTNTGCIKNIARFILTRNLTACKQKKKYHCSKAGMAGMCL
jgi:hypothetical protein